MQVKERVNPVLKYRDFNYAAKWPFPKSFSYFTFISVDTFHRVPFFRICVLNST